MIDWYARACAIAEQANRIVREAPVVAVPSPDGQSPAIRYVADQLRLTYEEGSLDALDAGRAPRGAVW